MTSHMIRPHPFNLMITRIRSRFIKNIRGRLSQHHPIALKPQITHSTNILPPIILHKKRQTLYFPKKRPLDPDILHFTRLTQFKSLRGLHFRRGAEIEIVAVDEDFQGFGGGGRVGGADEEGVEFYLGCESVAYTYNISLSTC